MNLKNQYTQPLFARSHFLILAFMAPLSMVLCILCFASGNFIIIQNLIYIPVIIACVYYEKKGFLFSVVMALIYFILVIFFTRDLVTIVYAFARTVIFIIIALIIANLSLAKRKEVQANAEAHAQLKRVIDAATKVSIIATDMSGTILTFNSGAQHMLGYSAEEVIGKKTPTIIHLESEVIARGKELTEKMGYPVEGFEVFVAYAKQGKHEEREWTYVKKDGKHITVNLIVTAVKDDTGAVTGFLGIATDISERKKSHKAMREVESRFSAIVDNAPDGIIFCEIATQKIIFSNPAMTRLFGYSEKEFSNMKVQDLHRDEDWDFVPSQFERHLKGEISNSRNIPVTRKDGKVIFVDIGSSGFSIGGKIYFTGFFRDVTERHNIEQERLLLELIVKNSNETVIDKTTEGVILSWNIISEKMYGYTAKEVIGKSISILTLPDKAGDIMQILERVKQEGKVEYFETEQIRKDGQKIWVFLAITPVKDSTGRVISISTIARDITERKKTEKQ